MPVIALLLGGAAACERRTPPPRVVDGAMAAGRAPPPSARRDSSGWNDALGPALLVAGAARDDAIILFPYEADTLAMAALDAASAAGSPAVLFGRGGARFSARLGGDGDETDAACELWPLRELRAEGSASAWAVGFLSALVSALPLDSVDVLSPRDSMVAVAEASRLASSVTAVTGASFQGLRFTVHDIRRFSPSPGVQAMVAHLIRRVNQEARPQEEQTLLIAERDSGAISGPYRLVYAERVFGREEDVATPEVLAGVHAGSAGTPTLVVARDGDAGIVYALIERTAPRRWHARWTSSRMRCS